MKNTVYKNASIVTGLSVAERGLGFLYRIVLSRLIGAEGLGLYQVALSLFGLFATIGTGGIPITVSRMITKSKAEHDPFGESRSVSAGLVACLTLSLPFCLILWLFGGKMPFLFADMRSFDVFKILLIGLCFSCAYAVFRGYFWGNKEFLTPSILEIAEESVMVIAGVLLLQGVSSPSMGAQKAAWAVVISYLFSFTASLLCFFYRGGRLRSPKKMLKPLFNATLPITSVRMSGSLVNSIVAVLLPWMLLKTGITEGEAIAQFGIVSGMVLPILFIPSTLIGSLALVLVPELSEDFYKKNQRRLQANIQRGLRFAFLLSCILIPFYFSLGKPLGMLTFSNQTAGDMIARSGVILLPMSLTMISSSMLILRPHGHTIQ
jgi:stage V sporulation protein B